MKDEIKNYETINQSKLKAIESLAGELKTKQTVMNELDKEINIANSNLNSAVDERNKLNDYNVNLKEQLAMSKAQTKTLAENKIDLDAELENADTELNLLKIKHNKLHKSINDASGYLNNLDSDLKDVKETTNSALKENEKLKIEQEKL